MYLLDPHFICYIITNYIIQPNKLTLKPLIYPTLQDTYGHINIIHIKFLIYNQAPYFSMLRHFIGCVNLENKYKLIFKKIVFLLVYEVS